MDKKYHAEVRFVTVKKTTEERPMKQPPNTFYIDVCFEPYEELNAGNVWEPLGQDPKDARINKPYFLNPTVTPGRKMSSLECTQAMLKDQFEYEGNADNIQSIVGVKVELVIEVVNGYPQICGS